MGRRRFDRALKIEAVKLVCERGCRLRRRHLDVHENILQVGRGVCGGPASDVSLAGVDEASSSRRWSG
jgi:transposase-like protein